MRRMLQVGSLLALGLIGAGCGAIFNGSRQDVTANSSPDGAALAIEPGGLKFTTPASLRLERKNNYVLTFSKEGYSEGRVQIQKSLNAGILVLDILAGLVGVIVDAATGSWNNLNPDNAQVTLTKTGTGDGPAEIRVSVVRRGEILRIESTQRGVSVGVTSR